MITEDGGRIVAPHKMFRMFATGNTVGQGDEFGMYQGARPQSLAFLDRFTVWAHIDYMPKHQRKKLIEANCPSLDVADLDRISNYVDEHLQAFKDSKVMQPISPRGYVALGQAVQAFYTFFETDKKKAADAPKSPTVFEDGPRSAETQAAWERAQRGDDRTRRDMGYDPFQAVSSAGTLEHERAALRQQPEPFAGGGRRLDGQAACPEAEVACEALELCVDKAAALTCAETVLKLLGNAAKGDAKFRRVRLGNKAVQERILAVDGGLEALCAAGFELAEDGDETVLLLKDGFDAARLDAATKTVAAAKARLSK